MNGKLIPQSTLFACLSRLGCKSLNYRCNKCDFWETPSGIPFSIKDGSETTHKGKVLYTQDAVNDVIRLVDQLIGAVGECERGEDKKLSLNVRREVGIRLKNK